MLKQVRDAAAPYLLWIKLIVLVLVLGSTFASGMWLQRRFTAESVAKKDAALREAGLQLGAAADALRKQKDAHKAALEQERKDNELTQAAGKASARAARAAQRQADEFREKYKRALKNPDCKMLMQMDIGARCGL